MQEEMDKKRGFQPRLLMVGLDSLHRNGGVPEIEFLKVSIEVAVTIASGRIFQSR